MEHKSEVHAVRLNCHPFVIFSNCLCMITILFVVFAAFRNWTCKYCILWNHWVKMSLVTKPLNSFKWFYIKFPLRKQIPNNTQCFCFWIINNAVAPFNHLLPLESLSTILLRKISVSVCCTFRHGDICSFIYNHAFNVYFLFSWNAMD